MSKFELFLKNYNVKIEKKSLDLNEYTTFRNWINGEVNNPSIQMISVFYNHYKHDINYDWHGLTSCFSSDDLQKKTKSPLIFSITTIINMYNSLFCNKIIKELSPHLKILVFDENTYDNISAVNSIPHNPGRFKISQFNSGCLKDFIVKTAKANVDLVLLEREKVILNSCYNKESYEFIRSFRKFLSELVEYDLILFNFWENENNANQIISRVADQLIYITRNSEALYDDAYNEFINFNNNLTILKSNISNLHRHINCIKKSTVSPEILAASDSIINIDRSYEGEYIDVLSKDLNDELNTFFNVFSKAIR